MQKPALEKVHPREGSSFKVGIYEQSYFKRSWHYHPEAEILLILDGFGKRLVGDHVEKFEKHDLVLIGGNLPHAWISDPVFYEPGVKRSCKSIFIQFDLRTYGDPFIQTPEMKVIRSLMRQAERGLKIIGGRKDQVIRMVKAMPETDGFQRFINLFSILDLINDCELIPLASEDFLNARFYSKSTRITHVHEYMMENFHKEISLQTAADIACMNASSFARFFKKQTGETFSEYLNGVRIDFASRLLKGTEIPVTRIAFESGYNSLTYFNKKFRERLKCSPLNYRNEKSTTKKSLNP